MYLSSSSSASSSSSSSSSSIRSHFGPGWSSSGGPLVPQIFAISAARCRSSCLAASRRQRTGKAPKKSLTMQRFPREARSGSQRLWSRRTVPSRTVTRPKNPTSGTAPPTTEPTKMRSCAHKPARRRPRPSFWFFGNRKNKGMPDLQSEVLNTYVREFPEGSTRKGEKHP